MRDREQRRVDFSATPTSRLEAWVEALGRLGRRGRVAIVLAALLVGGALDWFTHEPFVATFYVLPVLVAATFGGRGAALLVVVGAGLARTPTVARACMHVGSLVPLWNAAMEIGLWLVIALLASAWRTTNARTSAREIELREALMTTVSHDLRSLLASIGLNAQLLERDAAMRGDDRAKATAKRIRAAVTVIDDMSTQLLDAGKIVAGKLVLTLEPRDLRVVAARVVDVHRPLAEAKGVLLEAHVGEPVLAELDDDRMAQALGNVIGNAIKYTPQGGRVDVRVAREGENAAVRIQDTGPGLGPEARAHVFDRFWQAKPGAGRGSVGYGLAIARAIVEGHGGRCAVESELGCGSTFILTIPALAS